MPRPRRLLRDTRGGSVVEYLLLVGLIAIVVLTGVKLYGERSRDKATAHAACIRSLSCGDGAAANPQLAALTGINAPPPVAPAGNPDGNGDGNGNGDGGGDGGGKSLWDRARDVGGGFLKQGWETVRDLGALGLSASPVGRVVAAFGGPDPFGDLVTNIGTLGKNLATGYVEQLKAGNYMTPDAYVASVLGPPIWQSIKDSWNENPEEFVGRALFEVATIVLPTKIAKITWAGKLTTATKTVDTATDVARTVDAAGDAARAADKVADLAKTFKSQPMQAQYVGEHVPGNSIWGSSVTYLDDAGRQAYKLTVKDGKLYDANGKLFDTAACSTAHSGCGRAIFVMDRQGNVYASTVQEVGKFHHSSFLAGQPVAGAGELVVENGVVKLISNKSGHYRPTAEMNEQVLKTLEAQGIDVSKVDLDVWR